MQAKLVLFAVIIVVIAVILYIYFVPINSETCTAENSRQITHLVVSNIGDCAKSCGRQGVFWNSQIEGQLVDSFACTCYTCFI